MSLTTDKNNPDLHKVDSSSGQNKAYLILSDEERKKGFIRPVRRSYRHTGKGIDGTKMIPIDEYFRQYPDEYSSERQKIYKEKYGYVGYIPAPKNDSPIVGQFITKKDLYPGCGVVTTMSIELAETYARDAKFYGATFCTGCGAHLPVDEFVWEGGNDEKLGS